MYNEEPENQYDSRDSSRNSAAAHILRDAAISIGRKDHEIARRSAQLDSSPLSVRNDEHSTDMASRLLLSGAAGYTTRLGCFLSGLSRIPKVGAVATLSAPFVVGGITSSYMKTGEFTDSRSLLEGVASYGFLGQGFKLASQDATHLATQALARKLRTGGPLSVSTELQTMKSGVQINTSLLEAFPAAARTRTEASKAAMRAMMESLKPGR